jgi:hypothetical protein
MVAFNLARPRIVRTLSTMTPPANGERVILAKLKPWYVSNVASSIMKYDDLSVISFPKKLAPEPRFYPSGAFRGQRLYRRNRHGPGGRPVRHGR